MTTDILIQQLRQKMHYLGIDAYIIPSSDPHQNEFVPSCWNRIIKVSDFDGSLGRIIVTCDKLLLFVDGRYTIQAKIQSEKYGYQILPYSSFTNYLLENMSNLTISVDPSVITINFANKLHNICNKVNSNLFLVDNLVDEVVNITKYDLPVTNVFSASTKYVGDDVSFKLNWLLDSLPSEFDYVILSSLDEICWLLNLRAFDIDFNLFLISYLIINIKEKSYQLYCAGDQTRFPTAVMDTLPTSLSLHNYFDFKQTLFLIKGTVALDFSKSSYWLKINLIRAIVKDFLMPISYKKACKHQVEIENSYLIHELDAAAVISFLHWLSTEYSSNTITEISAQKKLLSFRKKSDKFIQNSFNTISGFAANGAIVHYHSTEDTNKIIDDSSLYLFDSGGHYFGGTTDITRTVHFGIPTQEQKIHYTIVLKGHLALARAKFMPGTCGEQLDVLARQFLWQYGLNYSHGTGHGVGNMLSVHEGPISISPYNITVPLKPNMILSNEPGLYLSGEYGIRIENLCVIVSSDADYMKFDHLTLVPYCKALIDKQLLTPEELLQISSYYEVILTKMKPYVDDDVYVWLQKECF